MRSNEASKESEKKKEGSAEGERLTSSLTTMVRIRFLHRVFACVQPLCRVYTWSGRSVGARIRCSGSAESFERRVGYRRRVRISYALLRASFSSPSFGKTGLDWAGLQARKGLDDADGRDARWSQAALRRATRLLSQRVCLASSPGTDWESATVSLVISTLPVLA